MKITTEHSASSYGIPVVLDDAGNLMGQIEGLSLALERLGWDRATLAERTGKSRRTVEGWFVTTTVPPGIAVPSRPVPAEALNVLRDALRAAYLM